jgi:serine protease Do
MKKVLGFITLCLFTFNVSIIAFYHDEVIERFSKVQNNQEEEQAMNDLLEQIEALENEQAKQQKDNIELESLIQSLKEELDYQALTQTDALNLLNESIEQRLNDLDTNHKIELYESLKIELAQELASQLLIKEVASLEGMITEVVKANTNTVVGVANETKQFGGRYQTTSTGSGVIVEHLLNEYYVITNEHVIRNADKVSIHLGELGSFTATLVGKDPNIDLAVLKFSTLEELPVATFTHHDLTRGQTVIAIGNPFGFTLYQSVSTGIVSGLGRDVTVSHDSGVYSWQDGVIQHTAPISPGNSGGALFDIKGNLIGINHAINIEEHASNIGFAIPSEVVITFIESLGIILDRN